MYGHTYSKRKDQPGKVTSPARGQLKNRKMNTSLSAIPPEFRGGVHLFIQNRRTPSGQSRGYRVTQLRTGGVHYRESAGTGPVNLKVVPNECCLDRSPWTN